MNNDGENSDSLELAKIIDEKMPGSVKRAGPSLAHSYNTHRMNMSELVDIINNKVIGSHINYFEESDLHFILNQHLHNYLASSYTYKENIKLIKSELGGIKHQEFEEKFKDKPEFKKVDGLRQYFQHYRFVPLEPSLDDEGYIQKVKIDYSQMENTDQWSSNSTERLFGIEAGSDKELYLREVVRDFEDEVFSDAFNWIMKKIAETEIKS
jgi:hypothetical protein